MSIAKTLQPWGKDYSAAVLDEAHVDQHPIKQFATWFKQALNSAIHRSQRHDLGYRRCRWKPSARIVLLKGFDERGFIFTPITFSRKGLQMQENPQAALLFWDVLERQRVEGKIIKVSEEEAKAYFDSRPEGSKIGAIGSPQSNGRFPGKCWKTK
jgi:pyridoxamine 5'-phosphate oxidase